MGSWDNPNTYVDYDSIKMHLDRAGKRDADSLDIIQRCAIEWMRHLLARIAVDADVIRRLQTDVAAGRSPASAPASDAIEQIALEMRRRADLQQEALDRIRNREVSSAPAPEMTDDQVDTFMLALVDAIAARCGEAPIIGYTPDEVREALRAGLASRGAPR